MSTAQANPTDTFDVLENEQNSIPLVERKRRLARFETVMLTQRQIESFEELFSKKIYSVPNTDYRAWLCYKIESLGTEGEAIRYVLDCRTPNDIPKKASKRKNNMPQGVDRYDATCDAMMETFKAKVAKKAQPKKRKESGKSATTPTTLPNPLKPPKETTKPGVRRTNRKTSGK